MNHISLSQPRNDTLVPCAIYLRVSTDEQAKEEHFSLFAQEEYCMAEIRRRADEGWFHLITLSDPGYTGYNFDRPGFLELIALVKAKKIGAIIVYKRERLFRNADLAAQVQAVFDVNGVKVLSCVEGLHDTSPHSVLMRQFIDANSQFERANGRKRQHDCLRYAASRGEWKGGVTPLGYMYDKATRSLLVDEAWAPLIREAFARIAAGETPYQIVADWRRRGIRGRGLKNPDKLPFIVIDGIIRMIRLPIYRGIVRVRKLRLDVTSRTDREPEWEEFKGRHTPLVTEDVWWKANRALDQLRDQVRPVARGRGGKLISPLQGLIRCRCCDSSMTPGRSQEKPSSGIRHRYYRCIRAMKGGRESDCTTGQVSAYALERAILAVLQLLEANPAMFPRVGIEGDLQRRVEARKQLENDIETTDRRISELRQEVDNLLSFVRQGGGALSPEASAAAKDSKGKLAQLEAERVRLAMSITRLAAKAPLVSELSRQAGVVAKAIAASNLENQHAIYTELVKSIYIQRTPVAPGEREPKRVLPQRIFRLQIKINSNYLLKFGVQDFTFDLRSSGYSDTNLGVLVQIITARNAQRIVLLEQGFSTQSADYIKLRAENASSDVAVEQPAVPQNPIQRALRWKAQIQAEGVNLSQIAIAEKVTKGLISQHIKLLALPQLIVDFLREGRDCRLSKRFSLRELQRLSELKPAEAVSRFEQRVSGNAVQQTLSID
jgi:site-specific DNA recombinase